MAFDSFKRSEVGHFYNLVDKIIFSIIACYVSFVFVFARVFRTVIVSSPLEVIVEEMPNPDHVLKIFLDIYLIREEARNFLLEQDLFARLLFLFRSPETLIKWTRQKYD
jgi:hypothetical protein